MRSPIMSSSILSQAYSDVKISLYLLKENWKAFVGTEIFAIIAFLLVGTFFWILLQILGLIIPLPNILFSSDEGYRPLMMISVMTFFAFLACQFGLAYDIISSGDMFAEFRGSFVYFRRYWLQYPILTMLYSWALFFSLIPLDFIDRRVLDNKYNFDIQFSILFLIVRFLISYVWLVLFIGTLPSITSQRSFKQSFVENFKILRKHPKRLFITWGFLYSIIYLPVVAISILSLSIIEFSGTNRFLLVPIGIFSSLFIILGGTPVMSLLATRIYDDLHFNDEI